MDFQEKNKQFKKRIAGAVIYALLFITVLIIVNLDAVNAWLGSVLRLLRPILIGLALAYLCNPVFRFFERRVLVGVHPQGLRRTVSLIITYLVVLILLAALLLLIVPQLVQSAVSLIANYETHVNSAISQLNHWISNINHFASYMTGNAELITPIDRENFQGSITTWWNENRDRLLDTLTKVDIKPIADVIGNAVSVVTDTLFGLFISLYLLSTKEKRYAQVMKLRRALFGDAVNHRITDFCRIADRSFGAFIEGKLFDSLIIGVLAYITFLIVNIPYAILIAAFIAVFNIIPIIGPIIGAIPAAFILLLTDPAKVIPFLIIVVILQQIDGNIIGPKILGSNTGVSSLCVVIAISTMGHLFGLLGMILGVPLFATVLEMVDQSTTDRLQKRGLPSGLENYYAGNSLVDPSGNANSTTDKVVQKLELAALHIEQKRLHGEPVRRKERFLMFIYTKAHKYHIITELSDAGQARFAATDAAKVCRRDTEEILRERRAVPVAAPAPETAESTEIPAEQAPETKPEQTEQEDA